MSDDLNYRITISTVETGTDQILSYNTTPSFPEGTRLKSKLDSLTDPFHTFNISKHTRPWGINAS